MNIKFLLLVAYLVVKSEAHYFICNFEYITHETVGSLYTCRGSVSLTWSSEIESVHGTHQPGRTHDDVEAISVFSRGVWSIPEGIPDFFPNLRALEFVSSDFMQLQASSLQPFPQLQLFHMTHGYITSLSADLFSFTPRLTSVAIEVGNIRHIEADLLTNLNNLTRLHLADNLCVNRRAENRAEVLQLIFELSVLCPPREVTTTSEPSTTTPNTTTESPTEECPCEQEIEDLRLGYYQLKSEMESKNKEIQDLQSLNAQFEARFRKIESEL